VREDQGGQPVGARLLQQRGEPVADLDFVVVFLPQAVADVRPLPGIGVVELDHALPVKLADQFAVHAGSFEASRFVNNSLPR
jgi:hypothetical protein